MRSFEALHSDRDGRAISVKVRVTSGCFHREHSPSAYEIIDRQLASMPGFRRDFGFEEHESGPEVLLLITAATAALGLAREVVGLVTEIVKARHEGVDRGDHPSDPIEVIVRRIDDGNTIREETVLRIGHRETFDQQQLEARVAAMIESAATDLSDKS
jgi:hypothetical protein